ncbi:MAG: tyrosine-type recombinase/integrase, partial [Solirubrobacteraceae bacterium]
TPETARMLTRRRAQAKWGAEGDPIFPSDMGTPMDDHNYRKRVFNPARKAAGVPWATPHKLRHGLASLMAERGYSPAQIAAQLGHADGGALALRVYVHPALHEAPEFVDGLLSGGNGGNAGGNTPPESDRMPGEGPSAKAL